MSFGKSKLGLQSKQTIQVHPYTYLVQAMFMVNVDILPDTINQNLKKTLTVVLQ